MTVKDRVGRVRHVAFRVHAEASVPRGALQEAIRRAARRALGDDAAAAMRAELTAYDGTEGLLRVAHTSAAAARAVLEDLAGVGGVPVRVEPLGTSGTMRAARRKWLTGEAAVRRRPRKGGGTRGPGRSEPGKRDDGPPGASGRLK